MVVRGKRAPMSVYRQELATGALSGKLYVLGSYDAFRASTATVQVYNPTTNTWTLAHPLPFPVNHNAAAVAGGNLYRKVETSVWLFLCPRSAA
jgi:N-acetylneuraminic acid mutarotase